MILILKWIISITISWIFIRILLGLRKKKGEVSFFHPFANDAGGGEKVLWFTVKAALQSGVKNITIISGPESPSQLIKHAEEVFGIGFPNDTESLIKVINLKSRFLLKPSLYPRLTILLQSLSAIILAFETLLKHTPNVLVNTSGHAFSYSIFRLFGVQKIFCYIHYPIVSSDMLESVLSRKSTLTNQGTIANSKLLSNIKVVYYRIFATMYRMVGIFASKVAANSTWTQAHITQIWKRNDIQIVFPPCDVPIQEKNLEREVIKDINDDDEILIISLGQFRPEKNQKLQVSAFGELIDKLCQEGKDELAEKLRLVIIGGCRNESDLAIFREVEDEASKINGKIELFRNASFDELNKLKKKALISLHTMFEEHFGICVVDLMSSGSIVVANNSGGPKLDIIDNGVTGYLALTSSEYSEAMKTIIYLSSTERRSIISSAFTSAQRFSNQVFVKKMEEIVKEILL